MNISELVDAILRKREKVAEKRSLLAGISGIDASGKGFIAAKLTEQIRQTGFNVANINVDGWLDLPHIRFNSNNPAENFYETGLRFDEMFERLILPLKENRSVHLTADFTEETAKEFRKHEYFYKDIDIILLEGIFLFKNDFKNHFDLKIWIECSFETALKRAIARSQENLSPEETVTAYQTIYFPAQKIHFVKDKPQDFANLVYNNDD